jgi:hypothetical protein
MVPFVLVIDLKILAIFRTGQNIFQLCGAMANLKYLGLGAKLKTPILRNPHIASGCISHDLMLDNGQMLKTLSPQPQNE